MIRGVPSARYGDATSGVVLVKSKAGIQPFTCLLYTSSDRGVSMQTIG